MKTIQLEYTKQAEFNRELTRIANAHVIVHTTSFYDHLGEKHIGVIFYYA